MKVLFNIYLVLELWHDLGREQFQSVFHLLTVDATEVDKQNQTFHPRLTQRLDAFRHLLGRAEQNDLLRQILIIESGLCRKTAAVVGKVSG